MKSFCVGIIKMLQAKNLVDFRGTVKPVYHRHFPLYLWLYENR